MSDYMLEELEAAHKAITSSYRKISKARETLTSKPSPPKPQITLAERNQKALIIALNLITQEIGKLGGKEDESYYYCSVCQAKIKD